MNPLHFTDFDFNSDQSEPRSLFGPMPTEFEFVDDINVVFRDDGTFISVVDLTKYNYGHGIDGDANGDGFNENEYYDADLECYRRIDLQDVDLNLYA